MRWLARSVGESAALLFTAGAAEVIAKGVVKAYTSNGATLSVLLYLTNKRIWKPIKKKYES